MIRIKDLVQKVGLNDLKITTTAFLTLDTSKQRMQMKYPAPINNPNPIKTLLVWQLCKANHINTGNERSL